MTHSNRRGGLGLRFKSLGAHRVKAMPEDAEAFHVTQIGRCLDPAA
jgi:hypothetical protein